MTEASPSDTSTPEAPTPPAELDPAVGRSIEAVVMVAEQPVSPEMLAELCGVESGVIDAHCEALAQRYEAEARGFVLARVAGGFRYQSHPDEAAVVERFVLDGQSSRLSAAALETLAIIAYKQPISRAQVAAIRGVNVDAVMRTLDQRGYIAEIARDPGPGQAVLFGTTQLFCEKIGIDTLQDLPPLGDFVPGPDVVEQLEAGLRVDADPEPVTEEVPAEDPPVPATDNSTVDVTDDPEAAHADSRHPGQPEAVIIELPDRGVRSE